jgi:choline dehydrogenase-like flavoprotein
MKKFKPSEEVDFVIVGSGAAGGVMAKQLAQAGFSVVVMEQGAWGAYGHEQDYNKDELINRFPSEEDKLISDPKTQRNTFRRNANEKAVAGGHSYGCVVGGGTVTYGASSWRHLPYEFNEASKFGTMKGTGIADWPVSYEEIEPYYTQAEWEIGISGPNLKTPLIAPMSKPYPCRPLPLKSSGALIQKAAAKLNLTVTPNVAAIITEPYNGRSGCINCGAAAGRSGNRQLRDPGAFLCARDRRRRVRPRHGRDLFRQGQQQPGGLPKGQMRGAVGQWHGNPAPVAAVQVQPLPAGPGQFQWVGGQVSDERQWRRRVRSLRRPAQRI